MKSVYIVGPLSGSAYELHCNISQAATVALEYYKKGYAVFCPHLQTQHYHGEPKNPIPLNVNNEVKYEDWLASDIYWLEKCDEVVFLPGWEKSKGASIEHIVAKALGKEITYWGD